MLDMVRQTGWLLTSRMACLALRLGTSQKMRREKRRRTASSRSWGRLVAPSTTTRSEVDSPVGLRARAHLEN